MMGLVYYLYERRLLRQVRDGPMPTHIGIILDGNRRYGHQHGFTDPHAIYELGARKLDDVLDWCGELAIPAVTLWVFSTENFDRPAEEVSGILAAIEAKVGSLASDPQIHRRRVRVEAIGKLELLPGSTVAAICAAREATAGYDGMVLTIAVAYGDARRSPTRFGRCSARRCAKVQRSPMPPSRSRPPRLAGTFICRDHPILISSSGPVEKFDCPASYCGRAHTANSISRMSIGRPSGR
jgi:short-chain Z-isoprenyl diphosphate synthase